MSPQLLGAKLGAYPGAPQQYDGTKVDIWAAGVMLCVMLVGRFPFEGTEMSHVTNLDDVSEHVRRLITALCVSRLRGDANDGESAAAKSALAPDATRFLTAAGWFTLVLARGHALGALSSKALGVAVKGPPAGGAARGSGRGVRGGGARRAGTAAVPGQCLERAARGAPHTHPAPTLPPQSARAARGSTASAPSSDPRGYRDRLLGERGAQGVGGQGRGPPWGGRAPPPL